MELSISLLLYAYIFSVLIFFIFSFFNIYHLLRFVAPEARLYFLILLYIGGSALILIATSVFLWQIDWGETINIIPQAMGEI